MRFGHLGAALAGLSLLALAGHAEAASLTVYAAGPRSLDRALAAAFEKSGGGTVEMWDSSTGKVLARLEAERANPHADVVLLADQSAGLALQSEGLVQPYHPQAILDRLRPALRLPADFLAMGADTIGLVVNPGRVPGGKAPTDWSDLTGSAWRGQVTMPNPLLSGTAADFVLGFIQQRKDGWPFFATLKRNGTIWPGPNAAALAPVKLGARSVLMAGVGHTALAAKQHGDTLELVLPASGTLMIPRPIIILKSSKNQALARRFVDFVLSDAGQALVAKSLMIPAVSSVKAAPLWPDLDRARFWTVDWNRMAADRATALKRFDATVIR